MGIVEQFFSWWLGQVDFGIYNTLISVLNFLFWGITAILTVLWINRNRHRFLYLAPILLFILHKAFFYWQVVLWRLGGHAAPSQIYTMWGSLVSLQGGVTILGLVAYHFVMRPLNYYRAIVRGGQIASETIAKETNGQADRLLEKANGIGIGVGD